MSIAHLPSVFVSSTCYDLAQVRNDLRLFLESLGTIPVLSEFSTFPVDPNLDAVGNCRIVVKEKADIFILVVGGRYGSETESGKSVTNIEYLEAKAKGIPCYIFVQKPILTVLPIWKKNKSGDFSGIVDSTKLFEFVESLRDPKENWVFPFDYAQDIIKILRMQMAYLFMDALTIRTKVLRSGLSEKLQDLSGPALLLAVQKPLGWEYRLFCQTLCDEVSQVADLKKDLDYDLILGKSVRLNNPDEVMRLAKRKINEILLFVKSAKTLFDKALPKAFGAPGEPGDVEDIIYVSKRFAQFYRSILEWTIEFRYIQVEDEFTRLLELIAFTSYNMIDDFEKFTINANQQVNDAVRRYEETKQPQSISINFVFSCPDMNELNDELDRLRKLGYKY